METEKIKIAQLTNKTSLADTDLIIVESATQTMKMTVANLKNLLGLTGGLIEESGGNANGRYIKFSEGTMVCYFTAPTVEIPAGGTITGLWTFPQEFNNVNNMVVVGASRWHGVVSGAIAEVTVGFGTLSTSSVAYAAKNTRTNVASGRPSMIVIGTWK